MIRLIAGHPGRASIFPNGSVVWFPRYTSYGHKMRWAKFDRIMQKVLLGFIARFSVIASAARTGKAG
jgi:hypothetical protein